MFSFPGQRASYYHHIYLAQGLDDETAFEKAAARVGYSGALPQNRTRFYKQVITLASQQVAAIPSSSFQTTSPVQLLSSASHASASHATVTRPSVPAVKDLTAELAANVDVGAAKLDHSYHEETELAAVEDAVPAVSEQLVVVTASAPAEGQTGSQADLSVYLDPSPAVSSAGVSTPSISETPSDSQ